MVLFDVTGSIHGDDIVAVDVIGAAARFEQLDAEFQLQRSHAVVQQNPRCKIQENHRTATTTTTTTTTAATTTTTTTAAATTTTTTRS